jgi:hypothetical protein
LRPTTSAAPKQTSNIGQCCSFTNDPMVEF